MLGCDNLWAMEVDTPRALERFRALFKELDVQSLASQFGVSEEILSGLGLEDFVGILNNPPPGIDELIALAEVVRLSKAKKDDQGGVTFDRVVIDTAPTGHTLRLLSFPDFLDGFLGKLVKLQLRVSKVSKRILSLSQSVFITLDPDMCSCDSLSLLIRSYPQSPVYLGELLRNQMNVYVQLMRRSVKSRRQNNR